MATAAAPPPLQRLSSAPATPQSSAASIKELDILVQRLAALSSSPALVAVARQHSSGTESAHYAEDGVVEVEARRPFNKTADRSSKPDGRTGRQRTSAVSMTQTFAGTPSSNRTRNGAPASRRRVIVGQHTHHLVVPEKAPRRRFEQREWANAARFWQGKAGVRLVPRDGGLGTRLASADESTDGLPEQLRRFVPAPGSLPEDGEFDLDGLAALPEEVLRRIALHHREARASMLAERAEVEEEESARCAQKATQRYLSSRHQHERPGQARTSQAYKVQQRPK